MTIAPDLASVVCRNGEQGDMGGHEEYQYPAEPSGASTVLNILKKGSPSCRPDEDHPYERESPQQCMTKDKVPARLIRTED